MNIKLIHSKVNSILKSISPLTLPIDVEEIAKKRGLEVVSYDLGSDVSGLLAIKEGKGTIGYNLYESKKRKRFTIAHELGHYELHKDKSDLFVDKEFIYRSANTPASVEHKVMEHEANYFASCILMPTDQVRKALETMDIDLMTEAGIETLAALFDVSTTAMSLRISKLGFF